MSDFEPIALTVQFPSIIVSKNALPAKNLRELIEWLKDNPDKASAGTSGAGSIEHIGGLLFQNVTGTRFNFVPYQGAAPALLDLAAGHIDLIIENLGQLSGGTLEVSQAHHDKIMRWDDQRSLASRTCHVICVPRHRKPAVTVDPEEVKRASSQRS